MISDVSFEHDAAESFFLFATNEEFYALVKLLGLEET